MAKKIKAFVKLALPAGKATPAPPVGPALGQHGVNIAGFCKEYNARTSDKMGLIIPVKITIYLMFLFFHIKISSSVGITSKVCKCKKRSCSTQP